MGKDKDFKITTEDLSNNIVHVRLSGDILGGQEEVLSARIKEIIEADKVRMILDFEEIDYFNSIFLGTLVALFKEIKAKSGLMVICNLNSFNKNLFKMTGLNALLPITNSFEDALVKFQ